MCVTLIEGLVKALLLDELVWFPSMTLHKVVAPVPSTGTVLYPGHGEPHLLCSTAELAGGRVLPQKHSKPY